MRSTRMARSRLHPAPLADPAEVARRHEFLPTSRCAGLLPLLERLRTHHCEVPAPDPLDGGTSARLLLLLETPGPGIRATRIVSADNPTGTGRNLRRFWAEAGLRREDRLIWNAVPWVIHTGRNRPPRPSELRQGLATLPALLALLDLRVAVLSGRTAAAAAPLIPPGVPVLLMPHPSPTIVCTSPAIPKRIEAALAEAAAILNGSAK